MSNDALFEAVYTALKALEARRLPDDRSEVRFRFSAFGTIIVEMRNGEKSCSEAISEIAMRYAQIPLGEVLAMALARLTNRWREHG